MNNAWDYIEFTELSKLAHDETDRRWTRAFGTDDMPAMLHEGAKRKTFTPVKMVVDFSRHDEEPPTVEKVVFYGPFTANVNEVGQRVFRTDTLRKALDFDPDIAEDLREVLRERIEAIVEQVAGVPARDSIFAKLYRRANGWTTDPFTPAEERFWQAFERLQATNKPGPVTAEEIEAQREARAARADYWHVSPNRVVCGYDHCNEHLTTKGSESAWMLARKHGWKVFHPEDPTHIDLYCPHVHDDRGNVVDYNDEYMDWARDHHASL